jgi:hypothetical protein
MQFMKFLSMNLKCKSSVQAVSTKSPRPRVLKKTINSYHYIWLILTPPFKELTAKYKNILKVKFTLEQATKAQRRRRGISLLFL